MPRRALSKLPKLPKLLDRKIYKTGQTRGADDDEIFQNRVSRTSTVLIPYPVWTQYFTQREWAQHFDNGFIVLVSPSDYFGRLQHSDELVVAGLELGRNALVFYETRAQWTANHPRDASAGGQRRGGIARSVESTSRVSRRRPPATTLA